MAIVLNGSTGISTPNIDNGGTVTASDITLDNSNPNITSTDADGYLAISGDANVSTGANIRLFGASHATNAGDFSVRNNTTTALKHDSSASLWNFQANDVTTTGTVTATSFAGDGSALTGISAGGFQFISSIDLANYASVSFTGFDAAKYDGYEFLLGNVSAMVDNAALVARTSSNGGTSYDSGASDYQLSTASYSFAYISSGIGNAAGEEGVSGTLQMAAPHLARRTIMVCTFGVEDSANRLQNATRASSRKSSAAVNAIQFFMSAGNLASGTITMYGKVNS